jgi:excisionase family DNA binding protein
VTNERFYEEGEGFDASEGVLTPGELAKLLRVDPKTVSRWAKAGKVPYIRTPGKHYRLSKAFHRKRMQAESHG